MGCRGINASNVLPFQIFFVFLQQQTMTDVNGMRTRYINLLADFGFKRIFLTAWRGVVLLAAAFLLNSCTTAEEKAVMPLEQTFREAEEARRSGRHEEAVNMYKPLLNDCSAEENARYEKVRQLLPKVMVQLLNTYQSQGRPEECIAFFDSLRSEADRWKDDEEKVLGAHFRRDVYVLLSYAMSRTEAEDSAARVMDDALQMELAYPTHDRLLRDYSYASAVYYCVPGQHDKVLEYGNRALEELQHCENKSNGQWLVSIMGKLYLAAGDVYHAIELYHKGYEIAELGGDTIGMANAQNMYTEFLLKWKFQEEAEKSAEEAFQLIAHSTISNPMLETQILVNKAKVLWAKGQTSAVLKTLEKARGCCRELPYNSGRSDIDLLTGTALLAKDGRKSQADYAKGMDLLRKVSREATFLLRARAYYEMAKTKKDLGQDIEAELDSMYAVLHTSEPPMVLEDAYSFAVSHYLAQRNKVKMEQYAVALDLQKAAEEKEDNLTMVTQALVQMEQDRHKMKLESQKKEMRVTRILYLGAVCLIVTLMTCISVLLLRSRRKRRRRFTLR